MHEDVNQKSIIEVDTVSNFNKLSFNKHGSERRSKKKRKSGGSFEKRNQPLKRSESEEMEKQLGLDLKELCFVNGREKDPKESASILYKLGLIYMKRCPDKIAMIQSAALLNAAIVREPHNKLDIEKDLEKLCSIVVNAAGVIKNDVKLISAAKSCKKATIQFRDDTLTLLEKIPFIPETTEQNELHKLQKIKINQIRKLQNAVTDNYTSIMSYLSDFCLSIMGEPPSMCRFALVGMGSLARREITPFSDFENVIVLEEGSQLKDNYCEIIEYFRWYSVIFQIILINFGETVVPSIAIPCLNDFSTPDGDWFFDAFTPRGISFDGLMPYACKLPLGRSFSTRKKSFTTELIKPSSASAMAQYLDRDQNLKNGYHLADVLSKTCFVAGDRNVYADFAKRTHEKLSLHRKNRQKFANEIEKQIMDDRLKFDVNTNCSDMYTTSKFNLKTVIYRSTTIFVSALGVYYGIEEVSCFEILDRLQELKIISASERHNLQYAVAIACEVRQKIYMKRKRQSDLIENRTLNGQMSEILKVAGGRCIADYFTIARAFQLAVTALNFKEQSRAITLNMILDHKYSIDICCKLRLHKTCIQICHSFLNQKPIDTDVVASCHYYMGISLLDLDQPNEAKKHFAKELKIRRKFAKEKTQTVFADIYYNIGRCYAKMMMHETALTNFNLELSIRKTVIEDASQDSDLAFCQREIGKCLLEINKPEEALEKFQNALQIWEMISTDVSVDVHVIHCLALIGLCFSKLQKYKEALANYLNELDRRKRITSDEDSDIYVAECIYRIGVCRMNMENYEQANAEFKRAMHIYSCFKNIDNEKVALCDYNINVCESFLSASGYHPEELTTSKNLKDLIY